VRTIKCRCGKTENVFKNDIGPFYVDECCLESGYDELGNLKKKPIPPDLIPTEEDLLAASKLKEDTSEEPEDPDEDVEKQKKIDEAIAKKEKEKADKEAKKEEEKAKKKAEREAKELAKSQAKEEKDQQKPS
jgi:CRISPR/Cas system CSM-associated protein Csm5 (group 7 of RAMP superfamily)